ncbi:MAG: 2-C-methyl-D-erythritol 2,4-cyclodiphosphate synthase [Armatimonadetes bacterium]|nr:2-C-methyl-D-erythritol 2,4-cyclodiphosphate synthase [Armatimonadota bacterium]
MEFRVGLGYDIHPFSESPDRELWLGGIRFPDARPLAGHSDADVILHAVVDALLGAAGQGDIGQHFPNTDARWKDASSSAFLTHAVQLISRLGWRVMNIDIAVVAEEPKVMPRAQEMREKIAEIAAITADRVNLKATTNEKLGAIGRGEGIACFATALLQKSS